MPGEKSSQASERPLQAFVSANGLARGFSSQAVQGDDDGSKNVYLW